jgi:Na+-transporting NADH:ubiquinone oxidoreductase subunit F
MDITVVLASVVVFMVIVFLLVGMLLGVKAKLLPSGPVKLLINDSQDVEVGSWNYGNCFGLICPRELCSTP